MSISTRLTFKQLRAFVAVYKHGKLSAAAEELGVSQSAVSVLIRQIEDTLGIKLFDRTTRSLSPTVAADDTFGIAERILQDVVILGDNVRDLSDGLRGRVRLAATPATGTALLPKTTARFNKRYGNIKLELDDCAPNQFLSHILTERVEFGIGTLPADNGEFDVVPILEESVQLICPKNHPLAQASILCWADLKNVPLITFRGTYGMKNIMEYAVHHAGIEANIAHEVEFLNSALWMVSSGLGVAILPAALARLHQLDNLVIRPLIEPEVTRTIAIVIKKGRTLSPSCRLFVDMLIEDVGNIQITQPLRI